MKRWARRIGIALFGLLVGILLAVTVAAVVFDIATDHDHSPATKLYAGPFVRVGKTLVAYRSWGVKGTPIVLLGGAAEPSWVWHRVGPMLAASGHRVVAVDLPPFGYTERGGPYTMDRWTSLVHDVSARLGLHRPLIVGHSLGAGVAAAYALKQPSGVRGIVMLDGDGQPPGHGIGWLANLLAFPYYPAAYRLVTGSDWLVGKIVRSAWGPGEPKPGRAVVKAFERPLRVDGTEGAFRQIARHGAPGVSVDQLRAVRVPRAVVWGAHDTVDPVSAGRDTAAMLGVPLQLVPGAGHLSMLTNPRAVAGAILQEER